MGMKKYVALKFSFFLSIPVLLGTFVLLIVKNHTIASFTQIVGEPILLNMLVIIISTLLFGVITLLSLKMVKKSQWLTIFGVYRIVLGIAILFLFYL
jgi:undecaprenyl pyrophosphate phosphatase UppP